MARAIRGPSDRGLRRGAAGACFAASDEQPEGTRPPVFFFRHRGPRRCQLFLDDLVELEWLSVQGRFQGSGWTGTCWARGRRTGGTALERMSQAGDGLAGLASRVRGPGSRGMACLSTGSRGTKAGGSGTAAGSGVPKARPEPARQATSSIRRPPHAFAGGRLVRKPDETPHFSPPARCTGVDRLRGKRANRERVASAQREQEGARPVRAPASVGRLPVNSRATLFAGSRRRRIRAPRVGH